MKWRYVFVIFASQFFLSWVFFAAIWYLISWAHGDLEAENVKAENAETDPFIPCVTNMRNFTSAILFSIETQHTIGYGSVAYTYLREECCLPDVSCCNALMLRLPIETTCWGLIYQTSYKGLKDLLI